MRSKTLFSQKSKLGLLPFLLFLSIVLVATPSYALWGFSSKAKKKKIPFKVAVIHLSGAYPDKDTSLKLFSPKKSFENLVHRINRAKRDAKVKAVLLLFGNMQIPAAKADEIRRLVLELRQSGKKVYALLDSASTAGYLIATACEKIFMVSTGMLYLPGLSSEMLYFKKMLDNIGLIGDFVTIGDYKTAPEPFLRETMSPAQREQMTLLLTDLYETIVKTIAQARKIPTATVKKAIDRALLTPKDALKYRLIDKTTYLKELQQWMLGQIKARPLQFVFNYAKKGVKKPSSLWAMLSMLWRSPQSNLKNSLPKIALIYANGAIHYGSKPGGFDDSGIWSHDFIKILDKVKKIKNLKAIVLRVNSPGGSALASDLIWKKLEELKEKVPLFVSMGNIAASGGYYISMGADLLFADPMTITGSIGVFGGKVVWKKTFAKLGINVQSISIGQHSKIFSPFKLFSLSERQVLKSMLERVYKDFVSKAAKGRNMPVNTMLQLAAGRVWTGKQAQKFKLVDKLGGLLDTLKAAKKRTGLLGKKVQLVIFPKQKGFFESLQALSSTQQKSLPYAQKYLLSPIFMRFPQIQQTLRLFAHRKTQILLWTPITPPSLR